MIGHDGVSPYIMNKTNGAATCYRHKLYRYTRAKQVVNFPTFSIFMDTTQRPSSKLTEPWVPRIPGRFGQTTHLK